MYDSSLYVFATNTSDAFGQIKKMIDLLCRIYHGRCSIRIASVTDKQIEEKQVTYFTKEMPGDPDAILNMIKHYNFNGNKCVVQCFASSEYRTNRELPTVDEKFWNNINVDIDEKQLDLIKKVIECRIDIGGQRTLCNDDLNIKSEQILGYLKMLNNDKYKITNLLFVKRKDKTCYARFTIGATKKSSEGELGMVLHTFEINSVIIMDAIPYKLDLDDGYYHPFGQDISVYKNAFDAWKKKGFEGDVFPSNIYEL
jgi:hypothetical protein